MFYNYKVIPIDLMKKVDLCYLNIIFCAKSEVFGVKSKIFSNDAASALLQADPLFSAIPDQSPITAISEPQHSNIYSHKHSCLLQSHLSPSLTP